MRVSGSLFTYAELSASIADSSFDAGGTSITTPNNKIVTVVDAMAMLNIDPLNGPDNRCPSYDELIPNDVIGGGPLRVVLTYSGNVLTANAYGGTPPYNYFFSVEVDGPCYQYNISNPNQFNQGSSASTTFSFTGYLDVTYSFRCFVTDDVGASANSNELTIFRCLVPETLITMADGTPKPLLSLQKGDILYDSIVTGFENFVVNEIYSINDGLLKASKWHIHILSNGNLVQSADLKPGDLLIDKYNNPVAIRSIDVTRGMFDVINISTNTETYIANGIRTHNKLFCPE